MSIEQNKQMAERVVMELNKGNVGVFDEVADPDCIDHQMPPGMPPTLASTKQVVTMLRTAFPDLTDTIDDTIADGDIVVQRLTSTGTMTGPLMGIPPTGKRATWSEIHIERFSNGKLVEHWANVDQMGMMMQVGLMQMPG